MYNLWVFERTNYQKKVIVLSNRIPTCIRITVTALMSLDSVYRVVHRPPATKRLSPSVCANTSTPGRFVCLSACPLYLHRQNFTLCCQFNFVKSPTHAPVATRTDAVRISRHCGRWSVNFQLTVTLTVTETVGYRYSNSQLLRWLGYILFSI